MRDLGLLESALRATGQPASPSGETELVSRLRLRTLSARIWRATTPSSSTATSVTAFAAMLVFLGLNGLRLRAEPAHATASVLALAAGEIEEAIFARWVKDHVVATAS